MTPPPLALFQKFIRFGSGILPLCLRCILSSQGNLTPHDNWRAERAAQLEACSAPTNLKVGSPHFNWAAACLCHISGLSETRLTYNCAHLRLNNKKNKNKSPQKGPRDWALILEKSDLTNFWDEHFLGDIFFWVINFLGENFWVKIFLGEIFFWS